MIDRGEIQGELAAIRTSVGSLTFYEQSGHEQRLLEIADALLAELEQAEQRLHTEQRDRNWWAANNSRERARAEARLAKADTVLVEALRELLAQPIACFDADLHDRARDALADWEQA